MCRGLAGALLLAVVAAAPAAGAAPGPSGPSLRFDADWTQAVAGASLVAGGSFIIAYDPARLPACRAYHDGYPGWQITAFVRFWPSGAVASYPLFDHASSPDGPPDYHSWVEQYPVVTIPAQTSEVETWFQNVSGFDEPCTAWDSDYGRNFHFPVVVPAATLHFRDDWSVAVDGAPRAGAPLAIDYDLSRLPRCRYQYNGLDAWSLVAYYRFDGGPIASVPVTTSGAKKLPTLVPLDVPGDARSIELWFANGDDSGCSDWDSDWGRNFSFPLASP